MVAKNIKCAAEIAKCIAKYARKRGDQKMHREEVGRVKASQDGSAPGG